MFIDTFFKASRVSFQTAPNNFRYNFHLFAWKFIEVFIMSELCGIILSLNRIQSYAYKQTSQVQQEEINYFKMNCQIEKQTANKEIENLPEYVPRLSLYLVLSLVTANMSYSA